MSHQLTLELPDDVYRPLLHKAKARGQSVESMAQDCLTELVRPCGSGSRLGKWAGAIASGLPDVASRHHEYLGQAQHDELRGTNGDGALR